MAGIHFDPLKTDNLRSARAVIAQRFSGGIFFNNSSAIYVHPY
jgi:hypothetical protein